MTSEKVEKLRKYLFEDGKAVSDAARLLGVPLKRAYYQAKKMGWTAKKRKALPKKWKGIDHEAVKEFLNGDDDRTFKEAADKFKVSKQRISQIAAELGIKRQPGRRKAEA